MRIKYFVGDNPPDSDRGTPVRMDGFNKGEFVCKKLRTVSNCDRNGCGSVSVNGGTNDSVLFLQKHVARVTRVSRGHEILLPKIVIDFCR